jgi:hypothetical protein
VTALPYSEIQETPVSRVYFHTPSVTVELSGAERAWLAHLASGPAESAWDLRGNGGFERAQEILTMVPEVPDGRYGANYLHTYLREAQEQDARNKAVYSSGERSRCGRTDHEPMERLVSSLKTSMSVRGLTLNVAGVELSTINVDLNTALIAGSEPIALAAKIHGWCESHCWVEGVDRGWLADIIDQGLNTRLYRRDLGWEGPSQYDNGVGVVPMLRSRDDEPVVLSYSVCDQFPNADVGDWMPPWPEGVERRFGALPEAEQIRREARSDAWYDLTAEEQWEISLAGLRSTRPWAQLTPNSLRSSTFHLPVNVYDLIRPDRDEHVRSLLADHVGVA